MIEQCLQVGGIVRKVDFGGVHDQQRRLVIGMEETGVGGGHLVQVAGFDGLLEGDSSAADAALKDADRSLQVNDQVRSQGLWIQCRVNPVVKAELVLIKGEPGEQPILFHQEIGHHQRIEQVVLWRFADDLRASEQKEQLGLQGVRALGQVEAVQKRVLQHGFEQQRVA